MGDVRREENLAAVFDNSRKIATGWSLGLRNASIRGDRDGWDEAKDEHEASWEFFTSNGRNDSGSGQDILIGGAKEEPYK